MSLSSLKIMKKSPINEYSDKFKYCHDRFLEQTLTHKHTKYDPLINTTQNNGWETNLLITIMTRVRGTIHEHFIKKLTKLKIPKVNIKNLMKDTQEHYKYLTYLVLNN